MRLWTLKCWKAHFFLMFRANIFAWKLLRTGLTRARRTMSSAIPDGYARYLAPVNPKVEFCKESWRESLSLSGVSTPHDYVAGDWPILHRMVLRLWSDQHEVHALVDEGVMDVFDLREMEFFAGAHGSKRGGSVHGLRHTVPHALGGHLCLMWLICRVSWIRYIPRIALTWKLEFTLLRCVCAHTLPRYLSVGMFICVLVEWIEEKSSMKP